MRLDFNTLWIDDQPARISSTHSNLQIRMSKLGFHFQPHVVPSLSAASAYISNSVFKDSLDLLFIDWDLGVNGKGNEILPEIGRLFPYRDIVFYSSVATSGLKEMVFDAGVEGVYCAYRDNLASAAYDICHKLIQKSLDIDNTRGIFMGATADFDVILMDCLHAIFLSRDEKEKCEFMTQAKERISIKHDEQCKKVDKAKALTDCIQLLSIRDAWTSDHKLSFLIRLLDKNTEFLDIRSELIDYQQTIVPKRNILAHARLKPDGITKLYEDHEGKTVSEQEMLSLRCRLLHHRQTFTQLAKQLGVDNSLLFSLEPDKPA